MSKFSIRLKELRNSRKLSMQELAKQIGMSKSSINMYERGEREPGLETLEAIADFFNVDLDYLLGKSDTPNRALVSSYVKIAKGIVLSKREEALVLAYRAHPEMQAAVNKMLDISEHTEKSTQPPSISAEMADDITKLMNIPTRTNSK